MPFDAISHYLFCIVMVSQVDTMFLSTLLCFLECCLLYFFCFAFSSKTHLVSRTTIFIVLLLFTNLLIIKKTKTRADKCPCLCLSSRRENKQREEAFCGRLNRIITWPCRHLPTEWLQHIALHDCLYVAKLLETIPVQPSWFFTL